ncbi:MAG: oligopeptide transporter, OPT family, partial [Sphingomonas sp.]
MGVLTATGMIVGESLWGVGFAGIVYLTNQETPLALVGGTLLFAVLTWVLYRRTMAASR